MRAIEPDRSGTLTIAGFEVAWEMFGDPEAPPLLMLPAWQIAPGLVWKMQVPVFAKYFRVITIDPPGIGKGERTTDRAAFLMDTMIDYCLGLLDHFNIDRAPIVGYSIGGAVGLWMAARHPERVERAVLIGTSPGDFARSPGPEFYAERESYEGWEKWNANYWQTNYRGWLEFFFGEICSEPHSSKIFDDHCEWALETTPEILIASILDRGRVPEDQPFREAVLAVQCPVLLIHGDDDRVVPIRISEMVAELRPDFDYLKIAGGSHAPQARQPVRVNQEILRFLGVHPPAGGSWQTGWSRDTRRALFISSPIGLGHVQRDLAIARELRELVPGLEIEWLAQSPVTMVLEQAGEQIHPLSNALASESAHWEHSAGDHRLHAFQTSGRWTRSCWRILTSSSTQLTGRPMTSGSVMRRGMSTTISTRIRN